MSEKIKFPIDGAFYKLNSDNKIELHLPGKSDYMNLPEDIKKDIKGGFIWGRQRGAWVSRSKGGFIPWSMKKYEIDYQGKDDLISFKDAQDRKVTRLANKAERYQGYAANANKRSKNLRSDFDRLRQDWNWITQPNINSSSGRAFTNSRNKVMDRYDRGMREAIKADNMLEYAKDLEIRSTQKELKNSYYLQNRLKENKKIIKGFDKFQKYYADKIEKGDLDTQTQIWLDGQMNRYKLAFDKYEFYKHYYDKLVEEKKEKGEYVADEDQVKFVKKYLPAFLKEKYNLKLNRFTKEYVASSGTYYLLRTDKDLPEILQSGWAAKNVSQISIGKLYNLIKKDFDVSKIDPKKYKTTAAWNKKRLIDENVTHILYEYGLNKVFAPIQSLERGSVIVGLVWRGFGSDGFMLKKIPYGRISEVKTLKDNYKHVLDGKEIPVSKDYLKLLSENKPKKTKTKPAPEAKSDMKKFVVGESYEMRFVGDLDLKAIFKVLKRTKATVTVQQKNDNSVTKKIEVYDNSEYIFPYGKYSMAPVLKAERLIKKDAEKPAPKKETPQEHSNITMFMADRIFTDEKRFQNRQELDQERVNTIAKDFDINLLDPIVIWKDPANGRHYVLSGHHRFAAVKQLKRKGVPARIFEGTEKQAINYALDSNTLGKAETNIERAKRYRKLRKAGKSEKEIQELARKAEGKNANYIINLSCLYADGATMQTLEQFSKSGDQQSLSKLQPVSDWVGEVKRIYPELTPAHETEMFNYLMTVYSPSKKTGLISSKAEWRNLATALIEKAKKQGYFNDNTRILNFKQSLGKDSFEQAYDSKLEALKKELNTAQIELDKKRKDLLIANVSGSELERILRKYNDDVIYAQKQLLLHHKTKSQVTNASRAQLDIFSMAANVEKETTKHAEKKQSKAKTVQGVSSIIQTLLADIDDKKLKQDQLLALALAIHTRRGLTSQLIDNAAVNSRRLALTPNNIIRWSMNPGRYDILGVDCPATLSATVTARQIKKSKILSLYGL